MTKTEQVRRRVVELVTGVPYEEMEQGFGYGEDTPVTLGRILKAIDTANPDEYAFQGGDIIEYNARKSTLCFMLCKWLLTRPDGSEATLEDQSEETIDALFNLLCHD